ncbi:ParA family protein [Fusobacterium gastrosuis]|uniref:ParA family protein n=1 Tax=Fusobacterium gastrosuis TaxID=1755100 RepID=UPI002972A20F|nr:ParA family protein [Fusobacteriaceae bacterium]MDY5306586.1 ParA family protein [Fusobacterium gastrosuis]MDY5714109.1 ParA family protein [Fusobacterium gastrosuis]
MKKITISVMFKKKKNGISLSLVRIIFKKKWIEQLEIEDNLVRFEYDNSISPFSFTLSKGENENINLYIKNKKISRIVETKKLAKKNALIDDDGLVFSLPSRFFSILKNIYGEITKSFKIEYEITDKKGVFYLKNEKLSITEEKIKKESEGNIRKKNIILIKVNKGGVGKTFLASQIAAGLSILNKKVLIITSDSQNNILDFMYKENSEELLRNGLIKDVLYDKGEVINLRKNLDFLPLESSKFGEVFIKKLKIWFDKKREEYDYIIIDSIPTMKIDSEFVEEADHIIIPTYCDSVTINGVLNLLNEIDLNKILAIQINKYKGRKIEQKYRKLLQEQVKNTPIIFPKEIPDISFIEQMLEMKKTIWEYKNKKADEIQNILIELIYKIIEKTEGEV